MPKKENLKKGETTRLAVEDAAISLFMEQGYHATSMRQIAERAGLALGGIYNHFSGKDEIFEAIIIDKHPYKRILPLIMETPGETAEEFLRNAFKVTVTELGNNPIYMKLMMIEMVEFNGRHGASMLKEIAPKVLPMFEQMLKVRKGLRIASPAMFLRSFFGMIISYFITEMITANSVISNLMPKDAADVYIDMYLHGVLKEPA
ncbi:MAG: TetR/AcrR family transcriptional regulator [Chloroflexi bacterium]|nr:TetR/AcrR family transcriptional regulator [Chloroflexota bacterium]